MKRKFTVLSAVVLATSLVGAAHYVPRAADRRTVPLLQGPGFQGDAQHHFALNRYIVPVAHNAAQAKRQLQWLVHNGFDIAGSNRQAWEVEIITTDSGIQYLEQQGIKGRVVAKHGPGIEATGIDPRYLTPDTVAQRLAALHAQFPAVTRLEEIGRSLQNRPIMALLISTTPDANDPRALQKPSIIFDGMHHAREIMTSEVVMDVAETLLTNAAQGVQGAQKIASEWQTWVVPMLNVDGNNIVWTTDNWWRKNARGTDGNAFGVDLNRNYPYRWASCDGSSTDTGAQDYHGTAAASEPETQALMRLADAVRPTASLSYHSYSELVLYPFGCEGDLTAENVLVEKVGKELAARLPSDQGKGNYQPGTPWQTLYPVDGDSMGYMFASYGSLAYTFEINTEFQPSYDMRDPTLKKHRVAWQYFFDRASTNMLGVAVVDAKTGKNAVAQIEINTIQHVKGEKPFQTNAGGFYFKVLDPGAYQLKATLQDGRSAVLPVTMSGQAQKVTVQIQ